MHPTAALILLGWLATVTACRPSPADSLADLAGTWHLSTISERGDTAYAAYELVATPDPSGWTFRFPGRDPVPVRVRTAGDSILTEAGPMASALRPGVPVTLRGVLRRQGDRLVGTSVAHFAGGGPDSLVRVRTEATRVPQP